MSEERTYKVWYTSVISNTNDDSWRTVHELQFDLKADPVILTESQFEDLKYEMTYNYRTDYAIFYRREFDENICDYKIQELVVSGRDRREKDEKKRQKAALVEEKRKEKAKKSVETRERKLLEELKAKYSSP